MKRFFKVFLLMLLVAVFATFAVACDKTDDKDKPTETDSALSYSYDEISQTYCVTGTESEKETIVIPEKYNDGDNGEHPVTSIGYGAFRGCTGLTSVTIPNSVTTIGYGAFAECGLTSIIVDENNPDYKSIDGNLYSKDGKTLILYAMGKNDNTFTIPDSVTSIGDYAFEDCTGLTSVTIGNGVTSIDDSAFSGCTGLTSVTIGNGVTSIDDSAFSGCTGLTSVTIGNGVTSIGDSAFSGCTGLTSVTIGDSVTSIGDWTFDGCTGLTSITIPDSVTSIGGWAFRGCTGLTSVTIGDGVTSIGYDAFDCCTGLTSIYYTGDIASWCGISGLNIIMSLSRTLYIDNKKVEGDLVIPDSVTSISDYAFIGCTGLTSITIPDSVTSIGEYAFENCTNIETATIPTLAIDYISKGNLKTVVITSGESIGNNVFSGCTELTSVTIGNGVTSIGSSAFSNCTGLTSIYYTGDIASWCGISGLNYIMSSSRTLYIDNKELEGDLVIPDRETCSWGTRVIIK